MAWFNSAGPATRGAAPVGVIAELPNVERAAIVVLRLWCDGDAGRDRICADFAAGLGAAEGEAAYERLCQLIGIVLKGGRRVLMRHGCDCPCFGGDESAFASMIAAAAAGDRDDAMAFALVLMPPAAAYAAVAFAEATGLALHRLSRRTMGQNGPFDIPFTKH